LSAHSSISLQRQSWHSSGLRHIISTSPLAGSEVLVNFADGSSAIYEMEELEKLRPTAKKIFAATTSGQSHFADVA
jgi:hypothetical protein